MELRENGLLVIAAANRSKMSTVRFAKHCNNNNNTSIIDVVLAVMLNSINKFNYPGDLQPMGVVLMFFF